MLKIRSTRGQREKLRGLNAGVGHLMYHAGNGQTVEFEFSIHNGELRYIENGKRVEYHINPEV